MQQKIKIIKLILEGSREVISAIGYRSAGDALEDATKYLVSLSRSRCERLNHFATDFTVPNTTYLFHIISTSEEIVESTVLLENILVDLRQISQQLYEREMREESESGFLWRIRSLIDMRIESTESALTRFRRN